MSFVNNAMHFFLSDLRCLLYPCLVALAVTSTKTLKRNNTRHSGLVLTLEEDFQYFTIKYVVCCKFFTTQINYVSFYFNFAKSFCFEWIVNFIFKKSFSCRLKFAVFLQICLQIIISCLLPGPGSLCSTFLSNTYCFPMLLPHCSCLVAKWCPPLCDPVDCSMPGSSVLCYLQEFAQINVPWVGDALQPSHPLRPSSPSALNLF